MNNSLVLAQDKIIEKIRNLCERFGLNSCVAQIFVVLYLSKGYLSLDDLSQRLKMSKGNVSVNIRELERWQAVRKIWVKGSRKDYYEAELDIKKVFLSKVKTSLQNIALDAQGMLDEFHNAFQEADSELSEEEKKAGNIYEKRLKKVKELNDFVKFALTMSEKFI